ncbi:MAG: hypothetical protein HY270_11500 [Deltaproteobacteria bacterium]|nr:hypothetical protein [Deltaproteobacteria bacterium]
MQNSIRGKWLCWSLRFIPAVLLMLSCAAVQATTTTFFNPSQVATLVSSGITSDTISSEGYVFTYTLDKLFTGGVGLTVPIGRPVLVPWPTGVEAQAVTTGPTLSGATITITRADGTPFDIAAFTAKLLANTAATGAAFEIMPSLNGNDAFNNPLYFDATGYAGNSFPYGPPSTAQLVGYDKYTISLFCDFALTALTFQSPGAAPTFTQPVSSTATSTPTQSSASTPTQTATPTATNSQAATLTPTATATATDTPVLTPAGLDHFACYKIKALRAPSGQPPFARFTQRKGDTLVDAFSSGAVADQHKVDVIAPLDACQPASINAGDPSVPLHRAHLEAYAVTLSKTTPTQPKFTKGVHTVQNELGTLKLTTLGAASVLLPSAEALGTGGTPPLGSTDLDHFKCYRVAVARAAAGQPPFPKFTATTIAVNDLFGGSVQITLTKPTKLCLPADLNSGSPAAPGHDQHLVCYAAKRSPTTPPLPKFTPVSVSVQNEFGNEVLSAAKIDQVCMPSVRLD